MKPTNKKTLSWHFGDPFNKQPIIISLSGKEHKKTGHKNYYRALPGTEKPGNYHRFLEIEKF